MIDLNRLVEESIEEMLNNASREQRDQVFKSLFDTFFNHTSKRPLPDIDKRVQEMSKQIQSMCASVQFKVSLNDSTVTITSESQDSDTLLRLALGTDWFEGSDVGQAILESLGNTSS